MNHFYNYDDFTNRLIYISLRPLGGPIGCIFLSSVFLTQMMLSLLWIKTSESSAFNNLCTDYEGASNFVLSRTTFVNVINKLCEKKKSLLLLQVRKTVIVSLFLSGKVCCLKMKVCGNYSVSEIKTAAGGWWTSYFHLCFPAGTDIPHHTSTELRNQAWRIFDSCCLSYWKTHKAFVHHAITSPLILYEELITFLGGAEGDSLCIKLKTDADSHGPPAAAQGHIPGEAKLKLWDS